MTSITPTSKTGNNWRHGMHGTPTYNSYNSMIQRCNDKNWGTPYFGTVTVCDRWMGRQGFINFLEDMGVRPDIHHTLDRIDNDKGYEPSNCRWATKHEQAVNRKMFKNNTTGHIGVYWDKSCNKWISQIRVHGKMKTLGRFLDINDAIKVRKQAEVEYGYARINKDLRA